MKKYFWISMCVLIILSVLQGNGFAMGLPGYINADQVNLRDRPSIKANVVGNLKKGENVGYYDQITDSAGYVWTQVAIPRTHEYGYVLMRYVSPRESAQKRSVSSVTTREGLSITPLSFKTNYEFSPFLLLKLNITNVSNREVYLWMDNFIIKQAGYSTVRSLGRHSMINDLQNQSSMIFPGDTVTVQMYFDMYDRRKVSQAEVYYSENGEIYFVATLN